MVSIADREEFEHRRAELAALYEARRRRQRIGVIARLIAATVGFALAGPWLHTVVIGGRLTVPQVLYFAACWVGMYALAWGMWWLWDRRRHR